MGKLLQKLVNGIVPSWLTKIKSSAAPSPKKLLPSSSGGTHVSSHKSSARSPSSSANNTGALAPAVQNQSNQISEDENETCTEACGENTIVSERSSFLKHGRTPNMRQKAVKNDDNHHHQDHNSPHHPHLVDVDVDVDVTAYDNCIHHGTQSSHVDVDVDVKAYGTRNNHGTQSSAHPASLSARQQEKLSVEKDNDEHDCHPQQRHRNCEDHEHQHQVEHHGSRDDRKHEKKSQCMQENVNHHQLQESQSSYLNAHEYHSREYLEFEREFQCLQEENSLHNVHIHEKDQDQGPHNGYQHHIKGNNDLPGFKRTSQYLKEKDGEEEEEAGDHGSSSSMTGWGWKRRKGEREVMSYELPESICSIVGNSKAVVKHSQDPHLAVWESMVEMIVGNGLWELGNLEFLLFCYLSFNEPCLHPIIQSTFLEVLKDLERTSEENPLS